MRRARPVNRLILDSTLYQVKRVEAEIFQVPSFLLEYVQALE